MCVEYDSLQNISSCIEVIHKVLVEKLKYALCVLIFFHQEEDHFEVKDIQNKINDEFKSHVKEEYFDKHGLESASDDEKYFLCRVFDGLMYCVCFLDKI